MDDLIEWILAGLYTVVGPGAWLVYWFAMIKGRARLSIRPGDMSPLSHAPRVSVIVPVRDEAKLIEQCVQSIRGQDWGNLQIVLVDDRSSDETGTIIDRLAKADPRVIAVHIEEGALPSGWFGKTHAMQVGTRSADGEWLVFVDSDCVLSPSAVRVGITTGERREFDLVSFVAHFVGRGFWDGLLTPLGGIFTSVMYSIMFANSAMLPKIAFACGQFLAIRRSVFDEVGGWDPIRDRPSDDVEMARLLKREGYRPRIGWGMDLVEARMYDSFKSVWRGWSRNFVLASRGRPWRVLVATGFTLFCVLSIFPAIGWGLFKMVNPSNAWGGWGWLMTGVVHGALITGGLASAYRWGGNDPRRALLWPISVTVMLGIFFRSLVICATGRISWRGTNYHLSNGRQLETSTTS